MSGVGTTVEVSAAVSAVVTAVVGSLLNWGARLVAWLRQTLPPDHTAINTGSLSAITSVAECQERVGILIATAPSRRLGQSDLDPDRAIALVHRFFGHLVGESPEFSTPRAGVRFAVNEQLGPGIPTMTRRVTINPSGRVDLLVYVPVRPNATHPDRFDLPLEELAGPILTVLACCRSKEYRQVMGGHRHQRFDWHIGLSNALRDSNQMQRHWQVRFPGRTPSKSGEQLPASPSEGFAARELRGWRIRRSWDDLIRTALAGFLRQIGYYNCQSAIADTVAAIRRDILPGLDATCASPKNPPLGRTHQGGR